MADGSRRRFSLFRRATASQEGEIVEKIASQPPVPVASRTRVVAGLGDLFEDTDMLYRHKRDWTRTVYDDEFDLYDDMLRLDPELNGAVRSVSLTANNWNIDYSTGRNARIRNSIRELVERLDFDDILINMIRSLMVYGNDINKLVGKTGVGITKIQSLPVHQMTIKDERGIEPPSVSRDAPIMRAVEYLLRENESYNQSFPASEIWHVRIDYKSNWFQDRLGRWTYGVWGASRFSSLKQPIRAKYNAINNRIALEDALTKQFITIDMAAVEHISDPDEQRERLIHIMNEVAELLEGLRGDQTPILPSYVEIHHVDLKNSIPDNSSFLDMVNADIAAVLQVPRVAAGQERGSTFAATYSASMWSINAIRRLQAVVAESVHDLFRRHLALAGIPAERNDIPTLRFEPIEEEGHSEKVKRATLGFQHGVLTRNEAREIMGFPPTKDGGDDFINDAANGANAPLRQQRDNNVETDGVKGDGGNAR